MEVYILGIGREEQFKFGNWEKYHKVALQFPSCELCYDSYPYENTPML